jgi:hypothetical protein
MRTPDLRRHAPRLAGSRQIPGEIAWRSIYRAWPELGSDDLEPGYTVLMPIPSDLPVFLRLALANVVAQGGARRREILVIPDAPNAATREAFARSRSEAGVDDLRLVEIPAVGRALRRLSGAKPGTSYFLQVHAGVSHVRTRHALLHDADLFLTDGDFLERHYALCVEHGLACLGVSPAWDDWLRQHGFDHVVATWELMFDVAWMRAFRPWRHRWHTDWLDHEWHGFDVTLLPQARTSPQLCGLHQGAQASLVHFNWVIGVYRNFQRSRGKPMEDDRFTMLLIRLLTDALERDPFGHPGVVVDVPDIEELVRGITDPSRPITYGEPRTRGNYPAFRERVRRLYSAPLFDDQAIEVIESRLAPFDAAFV